MTCMMTTGQVIRWWELRRLFYNAVLFVIGVSSIMGMEWLMTKVIPLGEDAIEPMFLVLGFRGGLVFSCILTTLPFWFACLYWATHKGNPN